MNSSIPICSECGHVLLKTNFQIPCPNCGARVPDIPSLPKPRADTRVKLGFRQRWPGFLGWMADTINRLQWAYRRLFSREILVLDLSGPQNGNQVHRVGKPRAFAPTWTVVPSETSKMEPKRLAGGPVPVYTGRQPLKPVPGLIEIFEPGKTVLPGVQQP